MDRKLIFVDIDGTLTPPGAVVPPESAVDAIQRARDRGHKVFLCSGRNFGMLSPLMAFGFDGAVSSAGGRIVCDGKIIYDRYIEPARLEAIRGIFIKNHVNFAYEALDSVFGDEVFVDAFGASLQKKRELLGAGSVIPDLGVRHISLYDGRPVYKVIFLCGDEKQLEEPGRVLGDDFHFCMYSLHVTSDVNGELINRAYDKGQAVLRVCEYLGVPVSDTIGFGDSTNDMELIQTAGTGVCMANGCDELKAESDLICPSVDDDGLARAFRQLGLI